MSKNDILLVTLPSGKSFIVPGSYSYLAKMLDDIEFKDSVNTHIKQLTFWKALKILLRRK